MFSNLFLAAESDSFIDGITTIGAELFDEDIDNVIFRTNEFLTDASFMTEFIELMEAEGLRDKMICCCGGARITHELAKELGFDAGFGMNTYADDVASFVVQEMVKRGMK